MCKKTKLRKIILPGDAADRVGTSGVAGVESKEEKFKFLEVQSAVQIICLVTAISVWKQEGDQNTLY